MARVLGFFERLPGQVLHALGDLGHLLWDLAVNAVRGFINGMKSMFGAVSSVAGSLVSGFVRRLSPC